MSNKIMKKTILNKMENKMENKIENMMKKNDDCPIILVDNSIEVQ